MGQPKVFTDPREYARAYQEAAHLRVLLSRAYAHGFGCRTRDGVVEAETFTRAHNAYLDEYCPLPVMASGYEAFSLWDEIMAGARAIAGYWFPNKSWDTISGTGQEDAIRLARIVVEAVGKLYSQARGVRHHG